MRRRKVWFGIAAVIVALVGYLVLAALRHGFSAREKPSRVEAFLARHARKIATPSGAKELRNPYQPTAGTLAEAREHFSEHCALCHGNDGRGNTIIGRNLYPKAPDMRDHDTQKLTDGELFYVISNGVRFTGMPAWGDEDSPEEIWKLVDFIRHLPQATPEELKTMETGEHQEHGEAAEPRKAENGAGKQGHTHEHAPTKPK